MKFCPQTRPFTSVDEMNEAIVKNHNSVVGKDDVVYFLGDVGFGNQESMINVMQSMNGVKHLIIGNHDRRLLKNPSFVDLFSTVQSDLFLSLEHKGEKLNFHLYHFPIIEWDRMHWGSYHLYGHVHGKEIPAMLGGRSMDVGLDTIHDDGSFLVPYSISEIYDRLHTQPIGRHHD